MLFNKQGSEDAEEQFSLAKERTKLARERTILAAERTISSWMRTGLASVGGGFAVIRFLVFQNESHRLMANIAGEALILCGIMIFLCAFLDYKKSAAKNVSLKRIWWIPITLTFFLLVSLLFLVIAAL